MSTSPLSLFAIQTCSPLIGQSLEVRFALTLNPLHAPGWEAFFSIAGALSFAVGAAGTYSIGIDVAGAHAAEIPFRIAELD
jgi:hypothetical protein